MGMFNNFDAIFKIKQAKADFMANHPKFEPFIDELNEKGFCEGQEIAVAIRYPDGTELKKGIRVTASDLELLNTLKELRGGLL